MTIDELKAAIKQKKADSFDYLRELSRLERRDLDNAGYKGHTNAEAIKINLDHASKEIEQMIRKWEKDNPD